MILRGRFLFGERESERGKEVVPQRGSTIGSIRDVVGKNEYKKGG
jgi:hypothetical protein